MRSFPLFDKNYSQPEGRREEAEEDRQKILKENRRRLDAFKKRLDIACAQSRARSQVMIQRFIASRQVRSREFARLAQIDNLVARERIRAMRHESSKRISKELEIAKERAEAKVREIAHEPHIGRQVDRVRRQIQNMQGNIRAYTLALQGTQTGHKEAHAELYASKFGKARQDMERARYAFSSNVSHARDRIQGTVAQFESAARLNVASGARELGEKKGQASAGFSESRQAIIDKASRFESEVHNVRDVVKASAISKSEAIFRLSNQAVDDMMVKEVEAARTIENRRELVRLEVRIARFRLKEASKRLRTQGTRAFMEFSSRRESELSRARARRKAKMIRSALALIRAVG